MLRISILVAAVWLAPFHNLALGQSQNDHVIVLGEDSDEGSIQRDDEVYGRVVSVLQNSLSEAGFIAIDEQLLSAKLGLEFLTNVRRQEFIVPLQAANTTDDPTVQSRLAFVFSVVPIMQDMSLTRQLKVRIRGEIYDLATLRMMRSTEVESSKPKILPQDEAICNEVCVKDAVGDQARQLAIILSTDLINKINELNAEQSTFSVLKLSLAGFDRMTAIQLSKALAASPEILASEVLTDEGGRRVYSVTTTKDVGYLEEVVAGILLDAGFDGSRLQTSLTAGGLNVDLIEGAPGAGQSAMMKIELGGEDLPSGDLRKLSGLLMDTFGADAVSLDASTDTFRTFSVQTDSSVLEIETKLADMMNGAGYAEVGYELLLGDKSAKVTVLKASEPEVAVNLMDLKDKADAAKVQQRLKDLGYLAGTVDGSWGKGSNKALEQFKAADANLPDDSAWDLATQAALLGN
jgi:hypothetical protein